MLAFLFIYPGEVPEMAYPSQMCACLHGGLFICVFVGMLVSVCLSSFWSMHRFIRIFFLCVFGCTALLLDPQWHVTHEPKHTQLHTLNTSKCEQRCLSGTSKYTDKRAWKYTHWYESLDLFLLFFPPESTSFGNTRRQSTNYFLIEKGF